MNIEILKQDKGEMDISIDNLTIAELMRAYLNKDSDVKLAAWKREHPSKPVILHIESANAKKSLQKAITSAQKDIEDAVDDFKKMK